MTKRSDVQTNDLSGGHLQFLVDTSLKILVEKSLKFLVLLVKKTSLFNKVLSVNEHSVVFAESFIKGPPH